MTEDWNEHVHISVPVRNRMLLEGIESSRPMVSSVYQFSMLGIFIYTV
jgi:hypothetical protein